MTGLGLGRGVNPMSITKLRRQKGWTQAELATRAGLSRATVQRLENGYKTGPEPVKAIATALGVAPEELQIEPNPFALIALAFGLEPEELRQNTDRAQRLREVLREARARMEVLD
jgi:transcriptional regulator with XRE-family HTH domain